MIDRDIKPEDTVKTADKRPADGWVAQLTTGRWAGEYISGSPGIISTSTSLIAAWIAPTLAEAQSRVTRNFVDEYRLIGLRVEPVWPATRQDEPEAKSANSHYKAPDLEHIATVIDDTFAAHFESEPELDDAYLAASHAAAVGVLALYQDNKEAPDVSPDKP